MIKSGRFEITDDLVSLTLMYSKITIALNAARLMKVLGGVAGLLGREINRTEEYLMRFAATTLMLNAAAVFDAEGSSLNLRRLIDEKLCLKDDEKQAMLVRIDRINQSHKPTIDHVKQYRDNLIAHTNKGIDSVSKFMAIPEGDIAETQKFLNEAADLIESLTVFPVEALKRDRVMDYDDIRNDLKE